VQLQWRETKGEEEMVEGWLPSSGMALGFEGRGLASELVMMERQD
jgi:hypothetical protein